MKMNTAWRKEKVADVINLVLGTGLFLAPWVIGFPAESTVSWNAWLSGILIAAVAIAALGAFAEWEEWLNVIVGLWVAASPWLVDFSANVTATRLHVIVGILVAVVGAVRIWLVHSNPPRVAA